MLHGANSDGPKAASPPLRVLIVEDNPRDAELTARVLQGGVGKAECEVTDLLESFRRNLERNEYDVILADFKLCNWTALDALEILKQSGKDIPLIVVTGSIGDEAAVECIKQGASDFVLKDRPARLPSIVQRALEERRLREERKRAAEELRRTNRALRTISRCNEVLVRATEESQLLEDICGILVNEGGYRMAWVGYGEHDEARSVRPVAHAGVEDGYLVTTRITWADTERGKVPTGTAIRTGKLVIDQDLQTDPNLTPWRGEARNRGYAGSIALPIILNDDVLGALTIYAKEPNAFDPEETRLLTELSNDLAYGIQALRTRDEHKRAEGEHVRLVAAIEQSAEAVLITDPAGNIEYVNPAFTRITAYSREEVLGKNPRILKSDKQDPAFYQHLWETILNGQTWQGELTNRRKDGGLYIEQMSVTPIMGPRGEVTHFIATKMDVTEHKALEDQVRQATKMEAIGRLAGGVAHDFNNLLTIINGYTELLLDKFGSDEQASSYLNDVKNAAERAASLTHQLLAFSRRQVLAPQVLDLNTVVSDLERMLKRVIGEDIKLHTALDPSLGRVKADPGQIEQVVMNLVVNARDAMPAGGDLTIETRNVELDELYARSHPTVKPGPHVMLAISDAGSGMTPETQARIFEPFFTTKEQGQGTGLGLATVYGIVKQSGGSIWVYSELGQGTVFKVYFPIVTEDLPPGAPGKSESDSASGWETVLVVEDEERLRSLVRLALGSAGYNVLETTNTESALETCANHDGPIHLLLTDVVMPKMSGPTVAGKIVSLRPGIKVLYMSGYTDDAIVHHGVLSHDTPFMQKPFSPAALRKKIRQVLDSK